MFSPAYAWNELRRRVGRTLVTAFGLAAGVGLVMAIVGVSDGLSQAQGKVLSPLGSVGTEIIVTRTVAPTTSTKSSTKSSTPTSPARGGSRPTRGAFFSRGFGGVGTAALNSKAAATVADNDATVLTDLAKLGKPGTKFTHDFFAPNTLITFPSQAVGLVRSIKGVSSATGSLSLQATHESGTVPKITATFKSGGQTIRFKTSPPKVTAAQQQAERSCIEKLFSSSSRSSSSRPTFGSRPTGTSGAPGPGVGIRFIGSNSALQKCEPASQRSYFQNVVEPEQTIRETIDPPTTNTETKTYTVAGVNPASPNAGITTRAQVTSGSWFTDKPADEVLVSTAYASTHALKVGKTITINAKSYKVVGLVTPALTGDVSDIYFDLSTAQSLASEKGEVNEVLVSVKSAADVPAVAKQIKNELPGATVLTEKTLADHVTGSLSNAKKLADDLGGALAIVVLLAAFLIAVLLTLASVAKRVREIGTLRAIGWTRQQVVRQIVVEMLGIGVLGAALGIGLGFVIAAVIGAVGPTLSVTSSGLAVGASSLSTSLGQSTLASIHSTVQLSAPIHTTTVLLGLGGAVVGGLLAGIIGGWRAARMQPAVALRDLG